MGASAKNSSTITTNNANKPRSGEGIRGSRHGWTGGRGAGEVPGVVEGREAGGGSEFLQGSNRSNRAGARGEGLPLDEQAAVLGLYT